MTRDAQKKIKRLFPRTPNQELIKVTLKLQYLRLLVACFKPYKKKIRKLKMKKYQL